MFNIIKVKRAKLRYLNRWVASFVIAAILFNMLPVLVVEADYNGETTYMQSVDGVSYVYEKFLSSGTFTVPNGVTSLDVFLVGGGGGGYIGGGGGGYTKTYKVSTNGYKDGNAISVTQGQMISVTVGNGGNGGVTNTDGEYSQFLNSSYRANGGERAGVTGGIYSGGSGGSGGGRYNGAYSSYGGSAESDGGNATGGYYNANGLGQGHTTREFGETTGTLYAGGGGGGAGLGGAAGPGGAGGGANGSADSATNFSTNGTPNTGGGGGGSGNGDTSYQKGGSGIVIIRWVPVVTGSTTTDPGYATGTTKADRKYFRYYIGKDPAGYAKVMLVAPKINSTTDGVKQPFTKSDILDPVTYMYKKGLVYYIDPNDGTIKLY